MYFGREMIEAIGFFTMIAKAAAFFIGVFTGWVIFWVIPTAWPYIKQWVHLATA